MKTLIVIAYTTKTKKTPFDEWIRGLDGKAELIVLKRIARLRAGNFGDCKYLQNGNGIWELRISYGPGYRIYFGKDGNTIVVLLIGGDKGSQNKDIIKAKRYWTEYNKD
jgi:putative addiction module killer protein